MGQKSSKFQREETIEFLLFKSVDRYGEVFREVQESELQPGDIVLFPTVISSGASRSFRHAAVYCGDGEVIHFQNTDSKKSNGRITKEDFYAMQMERGKCQIYRQNGKINLHDFYSKVREAMNSEAKHDFRKNNCIHFALHLLGLVHLYKELVQIEKEDVSGAEREMETIVFLLFKCVVSYGAFFSEVQESELQPGDIVLFPMDISSGAISSLRHAAVYCGDGEVIHFQDTDSKKSNGRITKEGFKAMKKERGKCQIYRKNGKINLNYFYSKVREAMNSEAKYDFRKNNCIHFALHLLGLVPFYKELVQIKKEDVCVA